MKHIPIIPLTLSLLVLAKSVGIFSGVFGFMFFKLMWVWIASIVLITLLISPIGQNLLVKVFAIIMVIINILYTLGLYGE